MFSTLTSFISSSISSLPFKVSGDEITHPSQAVAQGGGLWKHFPAVRTTAGVSGAISAATGAMGAGEAVSVFSFDKAKGSADQLALARNALQKVKTLRHPSIVKFIDSVDNATHLHIVTEPVQPLVFEAIKLSDSVGQLAASLGLHQIASVVSWINNDAKLVHSNVHPGSLYTTESGDWRLFGFDLAHKGTENVPDSIIAGRSAGILPVQYRAPELAKSAGSSAPPAVIHATDAWSLGCLIFHVFNANFASPQQLAAAGNVPPALLGEYKKLLATAPANRLNPRYLCDSAFFQNDLVGSVTFLEQMNLKSAQEKEAFFLRFSEHLSEFPARFNRKILPQLTASLDYGSGLTCFSAILRSVLRIGASLSPAEFATTVIPCVVKLFASNERSIRVHLLQHLSDYAPALPADMVNESIFSHVMTGFSDSNAVLRELTVKSLILFAPKLTPANMDVALRNLAKCQVDPEPAIRTNTGYCLAKLAPFMSPATQEKVLLPAFGKMLRDPFPPARVAGITSFLATMEVHRAQDIARKVLPAVTPMLADDVIEVRLAAQRMVEAAMVKMTQWSAQEKARVDAAIAANPNAMGSHQLPGAAPDAVSSATGAAAVLENTSAVLGSLGSWAVGAVGAVRGQKLSNADANPPKTLGQQHAANTASSNLNSGANKNYSSSASSSSILPTPAAAADTSNDSFFDDFAANNDDDADDIAAVSLSTKKKEAKPARKDSSGTKEKKAKTSILSGGASTSGSLASKNAALFSLSPPAASPSAASSNDWNFDLDDKSATTEADISFDDWGSTPAAASSASVASHSARKPSASSGLDLLSAPKKATPADPFASLSLGTSPKPASSMSLSASKPKAAASTLPLSSKAAPAGKAKALDDDWGSFLNN